MRSRPRLLVLITAIAVMTGLMVSGGMPVQAKGKKDKLKAIELAFQSRDFETALKGLKPYLKKKKRPTRVSLMLSRMYLDGLGVPANYSRAYQHLLRPAKKGNAWAATELGRMYLSGNGVMQSFVTARSWFEKAARVGYGMAQIELGHIYRRGLSVTVNPVTAYAWYNLAASSLQGEERDIAVLNRDQLEPALVDQEITIAQGLSLDWSERIEVVEPEIISLLDQAAILAEEKLEKAGDEIKKPGNEMKKKLDDTEDKKGPDDKSGKSN
jgi:hypothetical protein